jgi:thiamine phosphate synthase YjbQ (UPF0047 family)
MIVFNEEIKIDTPSGDVFYKNLTDVIVEKFEQTKIMEGLCLVATLHTTCSIFFEEYMHDFDENGYEFLQADLNKVFDNIVPKQNSDNDIYKHPGEKHIEFAISRGSSEYLTSNTDAHIKSTFIGNSVILPINNGKLKKGELGSIYFVDFDWKRERTRTVLVKFLGI